MWNGAVAGGRSRFRQSVATQPRLSNPDQLRLGFSLTAVHYGRRHHSDFVHTLGDAHLYLNHVEQAELQLTRPLRPLPTMQLNPAVTDLFGFTFEDFTLVGYDPHPAIKAPVAV